MGSEADTRMPEAEIASIRGAETDIRMGKVAEADISVVVEAREVIWMLVEARPYLRRLAEAGAEDTRKMGDGACIIRREAKVRDISWRPDPRCEHGRGDQYCRGPQMYRGHWPGT